MMNEYLPGPSGNTERRPKLNYFVRLASESSLGSEGTESIHSIQDYETAYVEDTPDTNSDSYFDYEIGSSDDLCSLGNPSHSSSGSEEIFVDTLIAAVLGDTSLEAWAPDGEEEDGSSSATDAAELVQSNFGPCAQCNSKNKDPRFQLCKKCFQVRKKLFPPRPKRYKRRKTERNEKAVDVDKLKSCLSGVPQQDSGIGSSQELTTLDFKEIKVPEHHLKKWSSNSVASCGTSSASTSSSSLEPSNIVIGDLPTARTTTLKRKLSETSSDDDIPPKKLIIEASLDSLDDLKQCSEERSDVKQDLKELCIMCGTQRQNGLFIHGGSAHACCCYRCALRTWKTSRKCPICNRKVNNVVKLYTF